MAGGTWAFAIEESDASGQFQSTVSPPAYNWFFSAPPDTQTGSMIVSFEPTIWLYDDTTLVWTEYLISQLPEGFQILSVAQNATPDYLDIPDIMVPGVGSPGDSITSWNSNITGWSSGSPTLADLWKLLRSNIISYGADVNFLLLGTGVTQARLPGYASDGYPTPTDGDPNFFVNRGLYGTWDDNGPVGATPGSLINPSVTGNGNPNEYEVDLTPGPNTEIVEIQSPDGTVIGIYPVGSFPVTVVLPGPTVVLTPINPNPSIVVGPPSVLTVIPQFDYVMSGGFNLGGSPTIQLIGDPAGIYTLVPGKTHDTLYERNAGSLTEQDVKIPDPFIKTAFFGD